MIFSYPLESVTAIVREIMTRTSVNCPERDLAEGRSLRLYCTFRNAIRGVYRAILGGSGIFSRISDRESV